MEEKPVSNETPTGASAPPDPDRREFLSKAVSVIAGGAIVAVPVAAGVGTLLAPLGSGKQAGIRMRLASVGDLPSDGSPKRFDVVADRKDAWTRYPKKAIGSVWLRKLPEGGVVAYNTTCPHLGCAVDFDSEGGNFICPCHASAFSLDGERIGETVSPRGMDTLEVDPELLAEGEIVVTYVNFKTKIVEKVPV